MVPLWSGWRGLPRENANSAAQGWVRDVIILVQILQSITTMNHYWDLLHCHFILLDYILFHSFKIWLLRWHLFHHWLNKVSLVSLEWSNNHHPATFHHWMVITILNLTSVPSCTLNQGVGEWGSQPCVVTILDNMMSHEISVQYTIIPIHRYVIHLIQVTFTFERRFTMHNLI